MIATQMTLTEPENPLPPGFKAPTDTMADDFLGVPNAVIVPQAHGLDNSAGQASGVFDADGKFLTESMTWRPNGGSFNVAPEMPSAEQIHHMGGTHIFGGPLYGHFGHFLMDSLARVWAVDAPRVPRATSMIFTPKHNGKNVEHIARTYTPLAQSLGLTLPIYNTRIPLRVDRLIVPRQGIGLDDWCIAAPVFREFMAKHGGTTVKPEGSKKLYISRSELPVKRSSILAEKALEENLAADGYDIFHPQKASQEEQIARYRAAEYIISPDGSPLHLLAYVGHEKQKVAILVRRSSDTSRIFEEQLRAFNNCFAVTLNAMRYDWLPRGHKEPNRLSWGEVDMNQLFQDLSSAGFISNKQPWAVVPKARVLEQLKNIAVAEGRSFHRYDPRLGKLSS